MTSSFHRGKAVFLIAAAAFLLLLGSAEIFAGGSGEASKAGPAAAPAATAGGLPIVTKPLKLSLFIAGPDTALANSLADLDDVKLVAQRTGITIDFIHPSSVGYNEALSTIIASGNYPDMIRSNFATYKGGLDGAINDGIALDYTKLVSQYAPNYKKLVADNKMEKLVLTDAGRETGFGSTFSCKEFFGKSFTGLILRKDWLDDLKLKVPETIDDWYNVLTQFKKQKNCPAPLGMAEIFTQTPMVRAQVFAGSYGAAYTFLLYNDAVKFGPILPEFKNFLITFRKWYAEGLINQDIATTKLSGDIYPKLANGQVGATVTHPATIKDIYALVDKAKAPNYQIWPTPWPQVVKGQDCLYRHNHLGVNITPIVVSTKCKNPVEAVKWVDYLYSPEGIDLATWGSREGVTWVRQPNGLRKFGPLIMSNPDKLTMNQGRLKYTLYYLAMQWSWEYEQQNYAAPEPQAGTWGVWSSIPATNYIPELITMSADESKVYTTAMAQVEPYSQEMILKFIIGNEPIEKFDEFVSKIKGMGIEKAEAARNAAYLRFKAR
jgi:putative aldouronate transport system substrate-binding protein